MVEEIRRLELQVEELKRQLGDARRRHRSDEPVQDYTFKNPDASSVRLSELFGDKRDLLVVHNMGKRCTYCTMWADGLNGVHHHLSNRAAFALCSPDEPRVMRDFAASRNWGFRIISSSGNTFNADMGFGEPDQSGVWPGVSAFHKQDDGTIVRTGSAQFGPGDNFCAVWHLFDLLKDGASGWEPKYTY